MVDETPNTAADDPTTPIPALADSGRPEAQGEAAEEQPSDPGRSARAWLWLALVAAFGLFLVFGSVQAHYWQKDSLGNHPVTTSKNVLDVWDAQLNGLPSVAHDSLLKALFLGCVVVFLGLTAVALWLATVEIRPAFLTNPSERSADNRAESTEPGFPAG